MNVDELFKMSDKEKDAYLEDEVSALIESAPPEKRERLKATHNRARMQVNAAKSPEDAMIRTNKIMMDEFYKLNDALNTLIERMK